MLGSQQLQGAIAGMAVLVDFAVKPLLQPGFGGKGAHQGQARDRFPQQGGQIAHLFLAAFGGGHHPGAEATHQQGHHGGQQQGGQGQGPVEPQHVAQHHQQLQGAGGAVLDGFVDDITDPVGVFGEAVGEIAGREFFEGAEIQLLQAGKQLAAQILADPQGRIRQQGVLAELGQLLHQKHR